MTPLTTSSVPLFEELRKKGNEAREKGLITEALDYFERAWEAAKEEGSPADIDLAFCNRSALLLELGKGGGLVSELRKVLLRNSNPTNCWLAAYTISRSYDLEKEYKKGLFYARIALDRSRELNRKDWVGWSHNQIGNLLLSDSLFDDACLEYKIALQELEPEASVSRALILDNLGYCFAAQGHLPAAFRLLFRSLRMLRSFGAHREQVFPHQALCYSYMEAGRYARALEHGRRALQIAESLGEPEPLKVTLYLVGEAANLAGKPELAHELFGRLQTDFYPESDFLPQFLLAFDVRRLVNLRA